MIGLKSRAEGRVDRDSGMGSKRIGVNRLNCMIDGLSTFTAATDSTLDGTRIKAIMQCYHLHVLYSSEIPAQLQNILG